MRNACRKDDSRGGVRQCANSKVLFSFIFLLLMLTNLMFLSDLWEMGILSSRDVGKPSIVVKNVGDSEYGLD
jgi:hypothetical protein